MWTDGDLNDPESFCHILDVINQFEMGKETDFLPFGSNQRTESDFYNCIHAWSQKSIEHWTSDEVLDFIHTELPPKIAQHVDLTRFESISGYIFKTLNEYNCQAICGSSDVGTLIFRAKEEFQLKEVTDNSDSLSPCGSNGNSNFPFPVENIKTEPEEDSKQFKRLGRPKGSKYICRTKLGKRSEKLWEFILHLLRDQDTCPNLIKWENFDEGTFKFVQSDKVARLWGSRKKNDNMTYEKFSRALRYYYKSEVLLPVPGRRLVYKFGPHAKGWHTIKPIN